MIRTDAGRFTTAEALEQEIEIVQQWKQGQGQAKPFVVEPDLEGTRLNSGQAEAIRRTLTSIDTHQVIHGLSGVGKTTALGELKQQLQGTGIQIRGFSPTITAAAQLQAELGIQTNTVEHLVLSHPDSTANQLWIIDEAGLISNRQMQAIGRKAAAIEARILLVGDKGQNSSVEAGSPLRSLMHHGATTHSIHQIIRQQNSTHRQAVEFIAAGNGSAALELLNQNGYVSEIASRSDRAQTIADQYLALSQTERNRTLIVTGTNAERLTITKVIRDGLKREGSLKDEIKTVQLVSRQFTKEQASRADNFAVGNYLRLQRDYQSTSLKKNQLYKVERVDGQELTVSTYGGRLYRFNPSRYKDKEVFQTQEIEISVGDRLRWTSSDKNQGLINGQSFTVTAIDGTSMSLVDKKGQTREVSLLQPLAVDYDLVSTSYRAQGKTAKRVIVSATSDPTSSREPFYVKISRQTTELNVYTQDLEKLRGWVKQSNAQENPLDLLGEIDDSRPTSRHVDVSRYSDTTFPDGTATQHNRPEVQSDSGNDSGFAERLHRAINRAAIAETLGGLRTVNEGFNRVNQQLQRGIAKRRDIAAEVRRLSESVGRANQAVGRASERRLTGAIQYDQVSGAIHEPLLRLKETLNGIKQIKPTEIKSLNDLAENLQQTINQIEIHASHRIRDEKLKVLAGAISHWRADQAISANQQLQKLAQGIDARHADQAASQVLMTQGVADSIQQTRAEDYIYTALNNFNQSISRGMKSLRVIPGQLNSTLKDLHAIAGDLVEIGERRKRPLKDDLIANQGPKPYTNTQRDATSADSNKQTHYRAEYNQIAKACGKETANFPSERLDLEVYLRAIKKGDVKDGARVVGESDKARSLRNQSPELTAAYVKAIESIAPQYLRLKLQRKPQQQLEEFIQKAIRQQMIASTLQPLQQSQVKRQLSR